MRLVSAYGVRVVALALFILVLFGSTGAVHVGMDMTHDPMMTPCPLTGYSTVMCDMNVLEHIAAWQSAFAATFENARNIGLLVLAFALLLTFGWRRKLVVDRNPPPLRRERHELQKQIGIFNPLREAFSSGIIHPKVF